MKFSLIAAVAGALVASSAEATCQFVDGNNYCNNVNQVFYRNVGYQGSYNRVTSFNDDGTCSSQPQAFSGSLSPLNEEVTVHFRGPINLKQFAVYYQGGNNTNTNEKRDVNIRGSKQHHVHKREADPALVTDFVHVTRTVYAEGQGYSTDAPAPAAAASSSPAGNLNIDNAVAAVGGIVSNAVGAIVGNQGSGSSATAAPSSFATSYAPQSSASPSSSSSSSGNGWSQSAYYNSGSSTANGLVFMNNKGGAGSGVFDMTFGNSISYAGSDGVSCASSAQVLSDTTLSSNEEFMIFSDSDCGANNGACGYYRPGIPAYHGFDGATKMFLFEFSMPHDTSNSVSFNYDMPAVWFLNAQIPRTVQYGEASCSCWTSGCGEFDVFEILNSGNTMLTSHLHTAQGAPGNSQYGGGGTPDWFQRPTDGTLRAAVIFNGADETISITQISGSGDFASSYDDSTISSWIASQSSLQANVQIS
ncbi:probable circularly permuted 1,3-beta-glucanase Tos1p [Trichomonascus vanleenenianus]|uniref:Tos1p n=1 Tax=Trichomonascus vanleenenianus TaxID=2268995 RepID=UPI003ECAE067